ncbi:Bacteriochlorophyll synthase 23 kDa chain [Rhodovastum atsumiense]|uniref:Bacteriochlorophyll 4-vinyl reductase n=1 Tax=Rhodovastum atsumiense TaxID=504468 RepID=A0A5M6IY51_9PROT|nr:bacteriochlorophyll 4-vinyl reductase [Rhodovastum atsumiense]KAA5612889.1 bacteriochlorophyll 4-vinyl reductase [Rhodovastum atsumiense]CAH2601033.1 Bacteriochlorophyll synthase 23 kDa chain [Rhodovastum atsumiense]
MTLHADAPAHDGPARIGPNAIIRVAEVLRAEAGEAATADLFRAAGLDHYLAAMPERMVDETEVTALQQALRATLGLPRAHEIAFAAGVRTADYLLAHRIPRPVQWLLHILPPLLAARVLLNAISRHAWTFAGSGSFTAETGRPVRVTIARCPICRGATAQEPLCDFYAGTFERLFRVLVHRRSRVTETSCEAKGGHACVFEIAWSR